MSELELKKAARPAGDNAGVADDADGLEEKELDEEVGEEESLEELAKEEEEKEEETSADNY